MTDGITSWISQNFPSVKLAHFEHDIGPAGLHNVGFKMSENSSKYMVFLDNDVVVTPRWLKELICIIENDPTIGIAQPLILEPKVCSVQHFAYIIDEFLAYSSFLDEKEITPKAPYPSFSCSGAAFLTRKEIFVKTGGYDPSFFIYADDTDYALRVRGSGYRIICVPTSRVLHVGGLTTGIKSASSKGNVKPSLIFHHHKNRLRIITRYHYSAASMLVTLIIYIAKLLRKAVSSYKSPTLSRTYLSIIIWFIKNRSKLKIERHQYLRFRGKNLLLSSFMSKVFQLSAFLPFPTFVRSSIWAVYLSYLRERGKSL